MSFWEFLPPLKIKTNFRASEMDTSRQIRGFFCSLAAKIFALGVLWAVIEKSLLMRYVLVTRSKEFQEIKWKWGIKELVVKMKKTPRVRYSVTNQLLNYLWNQSILYCIIFKKLIILEPRLYTQFSAIEQYKVLHNSVTIYENPLS